MNYKPKDLEQAKEMSEENLRKEHKTLSNDFEFYKETQPYSVKCAKCGNQLIFGKEPNDDMMFLVIDPCQKCQGDSKIGAKVAYGSRTTAEEVKNYDLAEVMASNHNKIIQLKKELDQLRALND